MSFRLDHSLILSSVQFEIVSRFYKYQSRSFFLVYHIENQKVNYRIYTTPEGFVTEVEMENKSKGKNGSAEWIELKGVESEILSASPKMTL